MSEDRFRELIATDYFVEWAQVHNKLYGTPKSQIDGALAEGRVVIMDVDVQGARVFREKYPNSYAIFILPPSIDELRHRIKKRDKMEPAELELRLENARKELSQAGEYDAQIINVDVNQSYAQFKKIVEEIVKNR
jgi:guanylate kinase